MICKHCAVPIEGPAKKRYCSPECKYAAAWEKRRNDPDKYAAHLETSKLRWKVRKQSAAYKAKYPGRTDLMGPECIVPECDRKPIAKDRCPRHYRHLKKSEGVAWASETDYASRAKMFGVEYVQFDPAAIHERDGWTCQLCDQPVDRELSYPDPMSVSLDHVVPMSKGGPHTPGNTQCSHLRCNMSKGDGGVRDHVDAVLDLTDCGMSRADIAAMVGVSVRTVAWIRKRYS